MDILRFPDELRVADESANEFLMHAMKVCAAGRYEPFRLLWSVQADPLTRGEFEQGWQAVEEIRIRAFCQALMAPGRPAEKTARETVYLVLADVRLNPEHRAGQQEPHREVVLMLVREKGGWRLAKAPAAMRRWIKQYAEQPAPSGQLDKGRPEPVASSDESG